MVETHYIHGKDSAQCPHRAVPPLECRGSVACVRAGKTDCILALHKAAASSFAKPYGKLQDNQ